jgi:hypothetical protein
MITVDTDSAETTRRRTTSSWVVMLDAAAWRLDCFESFSDPSQF